MGVPHVDYPGLTGRYAEIAPVQLLDCDTAHIAQGLGDWVVHSNGYGLAQSAVTSPVFGDLLEVKASNGDLVAVRCSGNTTLAIPVDPSTEYSFSSFVMSDDRLCNVLVRQFNAAGSTLDSTTYGSGTSAPTPNGATITGTFTTQATTATVAIIPIGEANAADDVLYVGATMLIPGSDATFRPATKVKQDLTMEVLMAAASWPPAANAVVLEHYLTGTPLTGYRFYLSPGGTVIASFADESGNLRTGIMTPTVSLSDIHLVRMEFDSSALAWSLFIDDDEQDTDTVSGTAAGHTSRNRPFRIGQSNTGTAPFEGTIAYARVLDGIGSAGLQVLRYDATDVLAAVT